VYQAHQLGKWNPRSSAYGRFWIDVPGGERKRRTVSLGLCAKQWVARLRLGEYIERAGVRSKHRFHQIPVPGTTFRRNSLKALHGAGNRGGFHAFRRYRFAVLRKAGVPENLITDRAGLGFELGELGSSIPDTSLWSVEAAI
jgi:hypothetical protein